MDEYLTGIMNRESPAAEEVAGPFVVVSLAGLPRGKGRPRFSNAGQFVRVYTDAKTRAYEAALAKEGLSAMAPRQPLDEPLSVSVTAYMPIPASFSKAKRAAALAFDLMPTGKPDGDNFLKIALDALNKIVWRDDSIIVSMQAIKCYSDRPRLEIAVWRWA